MPCGNCINQEMMQMLKFKVTVAAPGARLVPIAVWLLYSIDIIFNYSISCLCVYLQNFACTIGLTVLITLSVLLILHLEICFFISTECWTYS